MHGDAALSEEIRLRVFPNSRLRGEANLLIMPTLDAANISFNLLKTAAGGGVTIGPDPARRGAPGAHPHAFGDGAAPRQHDRAGGGRRQRAARPGTEPVLMAPDGRARGQQRRPVPGKPDEAAGGAGAHRRRRARRLPGGRGQGGARHPRQPGEEPVPDPVRHLGRRDQRRRARGVRRRLLARRRPTCSRSGRTCAASTSTAPTPGSIANSGARWLAALMLVSRRNPVSLLDNAPLRELLEKNLRTSSASRATSIRARSTRCASPPRATPPARACRSSRAAAASRAGSATSASARRSRSSSTTCSPRPRCRSSFRR